MMLGQELINSNGISQIALAFFTALFTMVGLLIKMVYDDRKEQRSARKAAELAAENANKAVANTKNISNGFARDVLGRLQKIDDRLDEHMQWHLEQVNKKEGM